LGWPKLLIRRFVEEGNTEDNALAMEFLEDRVRNFEGVGSGSVVARRFFCHWAGALKGEITGCGEEIEMTIPWVCAHKSDFSAHLMNGLSDCSTQTLPSN
jgi:hypothetical protein